jgi:hypothetical protein
MGFCFLLWHWFCRWYWNQNQCYWLYYWVPICWRPKNQKGIKLSSIEAKYVAISESVKEISFIYYLLNNMWVKVEIPIMVRCHNVSGIFMAENSVGVRCQHIVKRYRFAHENVEDEIIKIIFWNHRMILQIFFLRIWTRIFTISMQMSSWGDMTIQTFKYWWQEGKWR